MTKKQDEPRKYRAVHLFCGSGGGGLGFAAADVETCGAVDIDPLCCKDYELLTGFRPTCANIELMTPAELAASCTARPDIGFTSPPCKGFSGCLSEASAQLEHYQRMNALTLRGIWLMLEAWTMPPAMIFMENVPRIATRGRVWLERIEALLRKYGYAVNRENHDLGEIGNLAQHRHRMKLVARHMEQVPNFLYKPVKRRVRGIGEVLHELPVPLPPTAGEPIPGGPMHKLPQLSALNWIRLALIPAGGDWRDLRKYPEVRLVDRAARQNGGFGVEAFDEPAHAVLGHAEVRATRASVADPRVTAERYPNALGVLGGDEPSPTIRATSRSQTEAIHVADPRVGCKRREGGHGVIDWKDPSVAVIGHPCIDNFPGQIADPRVAEISGRHDGTLGVEDFAKAAHTVTGQHGRRNWDSVADPRVPECNRGSYGVQAWAKPSHCVRSHHNPRIAPSAVADPRVPAGVPEIEGPPIDLTSKRPTYLVIVADDGCWHRPLTTLELAALQGLPTKINRTAENPEGEWLVLHGNQAEQREHIGNLVPPPAAEQIALEAKAALTIAAAGGAWSLNSGDIWVRQPLRDATREAMQ